MTANPQHRQRNKDTLDRRLDQWIETGRQLVDGVAGNRPGQRKGRLGGSTGQKIETVSRWVEKKIDWLLEDDDFDEQWDIQDEKEFSKSKKPLDAKSKRVSTPKLQSSVDKQKIESYTHWPNENDFKISRWKRNDLENIDSKQNQTNSSIKRRLPRSNRRR